MRTGNLRRRISIQRKDMTQDSYGQPSLTWVSVADTWADIQPLSGRELEIAQAINAEVSHQVTIRHREGITAAMRIVYQGRYFNITSPPLDVDMRHKEIQLMCSEGLNDG